MRFLPTGQVGSCRRRPGPSVGCIGSGCSGRLARVRIDYVVELALTSERRNELLALLDDDERLRAEFPRVKDYLDTSPSLAGTGDMRVDAAFELRFVHYATGGTSVGVNPYWELLSPFVSEYEGRRVVDGGNAEGSARLAYAQMQLQAIYAYAIPSPETIGWVGAICGGRPLVELGAGRGYWAAQLAGAGIDVTAYDSEPPVAFDRGGRREDVWFDVGGLDGFEWDKDGVLFLCWPPGWGDTMASEALAAFEKSGGSRLVFVGEPKGGMTGDDAFFDALSGGWELASEDRRFVSWWNLSDVAQAWVRR